MKGSFSSSRCSMSLRVASSAVAVSATTGTTGEPLLEPSRRRVFRPEIVSPLGNAIAPRRWRTGEGSSANRSMNSCCGKRSGKHKPAISAPAHGGKVLDHLTPGRPELMNRRHAVGTQGVDLILHQRDEGDHHRARSQQRRDLVASDLPAAGGFEHQGIAPRHYLLDDLELAR